MTARRRATVTSPLRCTTFNMAVGHADAHAKNFSVLHEQRNPQIGLAPSGPSCLAYPRLAR